MYTAHATPSPEIATAMTPILRNVFDVFTVFTLPRPKQWSLTDRKSAWDRRIEGDRLVVHADWSREALVYGVFTQGRSDSRRKAVGL